MSVLKSIVLNMKVDIKLAHAWTCECTKESIEVAPYMIHYLCFCFLLQLSNTCSYLSSTTSSSLYASLTLSLMRESHRTLPNSRIFKCVDRLRNQKLFTNFVQLSYSFFFMLPHLLCNFHLLYCDSEAESLTPYTLRYLSCHYGMLLTLRYSLSYLQHLFLQISLLLLASFFILTASPLILASQRIQLQ